MQQKINSPFWNITAHVYAYVLFIIYMTPVVMIVLFSFQNYHAIRSKMLSFTDWTFINYLGAQNYEYMTSRGRLRTRIGSVSGVFSNADAIGGIRL